MPWTLVVVLIILAPLGAMNYYVWRRVLFTLSELTSWNRRALRLVTLGLPLWLNSLPIAYVLSYLIFGRTSAAAFGGDSLAIDLIFSYPFWFALVIVIQLFILFALLDFLDVIIFRTFFELREWIARYRPRLFAAATVVITVYWIATIVRDTWTVRIAEHTIPVPIQYADLRGLRIVQVSDVQGDGRTSPAELHKYVAKVNSLHPDLILFAGDLVTWGTGYIDSTAEILGNMRSRLGTIAAVGDHDMFSDKGRVIAALRKNGINIVEDSTIILKIDATTVAVTVVTYTYMQQPKGETLNEISKGISKAYGLFLVHQPAGELIQFAGRAGYDLFVAGHTHGGGIAFGIPGVCLIAPANLESKYVSGVSKVGQMYVSVSNGLGLTLTPIRFNAPAEITLIRFD